jgi:hypothetical protein
MKSVTSRTARLQVAEDAGRHYRILQGCCAPAARRIDFSISLSILASQTGNHSRF